MVNTFKELDLPEVLANSLEKSGFINPTPIQAKSIPHALNGEDVIASAQTGTGKTMAFVIPMLARLIKSKDEKAIVLMPTRELAMQVAEVIKKLTRQDMGISTAVLIGGDPMPKQLRQLKMSPRVIVGTPGRINDHIKRKSVKLGQTTFLVLDETDRMLDMGFGVQIDTIIERLNPQRQTLMFSATLPKGIMRVSEKYLEDPKKIEIEVDNSDALRIKQDFLHMKENDKFETLIKHLETKSGSVVLFARTKRKVEKIAKELAKGNHKVGYLHGDLRQRQREVAIKKFRDCKCRIMVATDVAARGLDIPHIEHVINYDLPTCPEDYVHRIGRTGRAGATGEAVCYISPEDRRCWSDLQHYLDPTAPKDRIPSDKRKPRGNGRKRSASSSRRRPSEGGRSFAEGRRGSSEGGKRRSFGSSKPSGSFAGAKKRTDRRKSFKSA